MMNIESIKNFHLPRYEELPDLDIYMDQVLQLLNRYVDPIIESDMTKTMINNYVKKGVVNPPVKKKYTKEHLAHLIVVSFLKMIYSMDEITLLIQFQMHACDIQRAYNYFCDEMECCLISTFTNQEIKHATRQGLQDEFDVYALQITIRSVVDKIYVLQTMDTMTKKIEEKK